MSKKSIITTAIILTVCLAVGGTVGGLIYSNRNGIKSAISKGIVFSKEDLDKACKEVEKQHQETMKNQILQIETYKTQIAVLNQNVTRLSGHVATLTSTDVSNKEKMKELQESVVSLNLVVENLETIKTNNEETISTLNAQIKNLNAEIVILTSTGLEEKEKINSLVNQVSNLTTIKQQLEKKNTEDLNTINELNSRIVNLTNLISSYSNSAITNTNTITQLQSQIVDLNKSISYYQQLLSSLQSENKCIVTFEFNDNIYNVQIVEKNSYASVSNPTSTPNVTFLFWSLDGINEVNVATYEITASTTFKAVSEVKFDVKFMNGDIPIETQKVLKGNYSSNVNIENTPYIEFLGWTLNGIDIINVDEISITQNTIFFAKFENSFNVSYVVQNETTSSQIVKNNKKPNVVTEPNVVGKRFLGWSIDGTNTVDPSTITITSNTNFIAKFIDLYEVKFVSDDVEISSQYVLNSNELDVPANQIKENYSFQGWTIDGIDIVNLSTLTISENTILTAKFAIKQYTVTFKVDGTIFDSKVVNSGDFVNISLIPAKQHYIFKGWSIDNSNIINLNTLKIKSNLNIVAIFEAINYLVTFNWPNNQLSSKYATTYQINHGQSLSSILPISDYFKYSTLLDYSVNGVSFMFIGFTINGKNVDRNSIFNYSENVIILGDWIMRP